MQLSANDQAYYTLIVEQLHQRFRHIAAPLGPQCAASLETLTANEFSQIAVLLPRLLNERLPIAEPIQQQLSVASLAAWWYGQTFDDLLDGAASASTLIAAQLGFLTAIEGYTADQPTAWPWLRAAMERSALAYAREQAIHQQAWAWDAAVLASYDQRLVVERAAPLLLLVQLQAAHSSKASPETVTAFNVALEGMIVARQLSDDASDWQSDLVNGRLNLVSARLLSSFLAERGSLPANLEQLVGYQISAEATWASLEAAYRLACDQALANLAKIDAQALKQLILAQEPLGRVVFTDRQRQRHQWRSIFAPSLT